MDIQPVPIEQAEAVPTPSTPSSSTTQTPPTEQAGPTLVEDVLEKRLGHIREFLEKGGTQREFCAERGINFTTFNKWFRVYQRRGEKFLREKHAQKDRSTKHNGPYTADQRRQAVEAFLKSGATQDDFARLWGIGTKTLNYWLARYEEGGPKALEKCVSTMGRPRRRGMREAIEGVKKAHPHFGLRKVRDFLFRFGGMKVSLGSVKNSLKGRGYPAGGTKRHKDKKPLIRRFERAVAGELWQSDITSFNLPRNSQRVYLTVFLDDYSRYIVSWGLALQQKQGLVTEALLAGIQRFGKPKEVLTDQGRQYFSWRGKGDFQKLLQKEGIHHVVARTHHPQTVGKTERFWATVMEEFWERYQPQELEEARERLGHFINHYNHFRPHQGIGGMVPADRFFGVESQVRKALEGAMGKNELHLAVDEVPRKTVYLVGQIGDQQVSLHGEKGKVVIQTPDGRVRELGMDGLGVGPREGANGRGGEEAKGTEEQGAEEVQVPGEAGAAGEGGMGVGHAGAEGEGAPGVGGPAGILDGEDHEGRGGPEAGGAAFAHLAVEPPRVVGPGGGAGEAAAEEGDEGGAAGA